MEKFELFKILEVSQEVSVCARGVEDSSVRSLQVWVIMSHQNSGPT